MAARTVAVKSAREKMGAGLVTCELTVEASATAAAKADVFVMNGALDSPRDDMLSSMGSGMGWYDALVWYPAL